MFLNGVMVDVRKNRTSGSNPGSAIAGGGSSIGRTHKFIVDPVRDPISNTKKTKTGSAKPMMSVRIRPLPFFSIVYHLCQPYAYPISLV